MKDNIKTINFSADKICCLKASSAGSRSQKMLEMNFSQFSSVEAQFLGKTIALFVGSGNETLYQVYDPWSNDLTDMKSLGTPVENITAVLFPGMNTLPQNAKIGPIVYIEVLY